MALADPKFILMAEKALQWVATPEGQDAAERAVNEARETVRITLEAQRMWSKMIWH